jgi:hypothetical protein
MTFSLNPGVTSNQYSHGQVYDEATSTWTDLVWVQSNAALNHAGDAEYYGIVQQLAYTQGGVIRPLVSPERWISGGVIPDGFTILSAGAFAVAKLTLGGADVSTTLPGVGSIVNNIQVQTLAASRVGWTGRVGGAAELLSTTMYKIPWVGSTGYFGGLFNTGLPPLFCTDLASLNAWLAANLPELGVCFRIGYNFVATYTNGSTSYPRLVAGELLIGSTYDGVAGFRPQLQFSNISDISGFNPPNSVTTACSGTVQAQGPVYSATSVQLPSARTGGATMGAAYTNPTVPAAGGGIMTADLYNAGTGYRVGFIVDITVTSAGRMSNIALTPYGTGYYSAGSGEVTYAICDIDGI